MLDTVWLNRWQLQSFSLLWRSWQLSSRFATASIVVVKDPLRIHSRVQMMMTMFLSSRLCLPWEWKMKSPHWSTLVLPCHRTIHSPCWYVLQSSITTTIDLLSGPLHPNTLRVFHYPATSSLGVCIFLHHLKTPPDFLKLLKIPPEDLQRSPNSPVLKTSTGLPLTSLCFWSFTTTSNRFPTLRPPFLSTPSTFAPFLEDFWKLACESFNCTDHSFLFWIDIFPWSLCFLQLWIPVCFSCPCICFTSPIPLFIFLPFFPCSLLFSCTFPFSVIRPRSSWAVEHYSVFWTGSEHFGALYLLF